MMHTRKIQIKEGVEKTEYLEHLISILEQNEEDRKNGNMMTLEECNKRLEKLIGCKLS